MSPVRVAVAYRVAAHAALLAWLWQELAPLPNGAAYTTIAWGLYAAGLLVAGLRLDGPFLMRTGIATLFLVVGKLFLVDLAGSRRSGAYCSFIGFGGLSSSSATTCPTSGSQHRYGRWRLAGNGRLSPGRELRKR
jgi:hypothetical protein